VRYFGRLPLLLQMAFIVGLMLLLTTAVVGIFAPIVWVFALIASESSASPPWYIDPIRLFIIAANLGALSGACVFAVTTYSRRFRRPDRRPFPLDSWQSQVRVIALLAALPLGAIVVVLILPLGWPPDNFALPLGWPADFLPIGITLLAWGALLAAYVWLISVAVRQAADQRQHQRTW
jgi:heme/copper-type cytochrome/quinol oxidase subunit 1